MSQIKTGAALGILTTSAILWAIVVNQKPIVTAVEHFECRNGELWYGYDEHDVKPLKTRLGVVKCKQLEKVK